MVRTLDFQFLVEGLHLDGSQEVRVRVPVGSENFCPISKITYISTFSAWFNPSSKIPKNES